jgi:hypothetical protein
MTIAAGTVGIGTDGTSPRLEFRLSFEITEEDGHNGRVLLAVQGVIYSEEGAELFGRIREALDEHEEVALDLRRCVFIDPTHLTSVLRLRRIGNGNASQLSLMAGS